MNWVDIFIEKLKKTSQPIYLYGAGYLAKLYKDLLQKHGIPFQGYLVDKAYLPEKREIDGKPVIAAEDLTEDIVLIMAIRANGFGMHFPASPHFKEILATDLSTYVTFGAFDENFISDHHAELDALYTGLADSESRFALMQFLTQRVTGTYHKPYSSEPQYFDPTVYTPSENEVMVDCGAYTGDSLLGFQAFLGQNGISSFRRYYALEPDAENYAKLCEAAKASNNVLTFPIGAYDEKTTLHFHAGQDEHSNISDTGEITIEVDTIDNIVGDAPVTFIKMDIEGAEMTALQGAKETILRCKPRMAVCVYHRKEDLLEIPAFLHSLVPEYRFYLRSYDPTSVETVLYAIAD